MSAVEAARLREVTELVHYTTSPGIMGTLMTGRLLSRKRLEGNEEIAFVREAIWPTRLPKWDDHISLSITRINKDLHDRSRQHYPEHWWGILSFATSILDDEDVWFATCNNLWPSCERTQHAVGFEALFADTVEGKFQVDTERSAAMPANWPTDRSAEVLYPGEITLDHLQRIYVTDLAHRALIIAWSETFSIDIPEVVVDASRFD